MSTEPLPPSAGFHPNPSRPNFKAPPGSWDTAFHIVHPPKDGAPPDPHYPHAPASAANAMHATLGLDRAVLVQPGSEADADYDTMIKDLQTNPRMRGMAVVRFDATDADFERLDRAGVRGIRFHFVKFLNRRPTMDFFRRSVERVVPLGWHLAVHLDATQLAELGPILRELPLPVIINHLGRLDTSLGLNQPELKTLLELHRSENIWVQIGNLDRTSKVGPPSFADGIPLVRAVAENVPDRVVWGSDWPHIGYKSRAEPNYPAPDDGHLLNLLYDSVRDEGLLKNILADNPSRLYDALR